MHAKRERKALLGGVESAPSKNILLYSSVDGSSHQHQADKRTASWCFVSKVYTRVGSGSSTAAATAAV